MRERDDDARPVVVITGAGGLIGSALLERMGGRYATFALDVERPLHLPAGSWFHRCDLTDDASVTAAFDAIEAEGVERIASVIHLAAHYDFSGAPSPLYRNLTIEGTRRLLRELRRFDVEQLVFSSTILVMKPAEDGLITESSPEEGSWPYPSSKLEAEELIRSERGTIPAVILRIAGVYDADCRAVPIAQQVRRILEKRFISYFFPGDASHGQPFVHLDDLTACIELSVERREQLEPYEVFLVAEPDVVSYEELQDRIGRALHGKAWPTIRIPAPVAKAGAWVREHLASDGEPFIKPWMVDHADDHYPVSVEHARRTLGWEPRHRLKRDLDLMLARVKQDTVRWYRTNHLPLEGIEQASESK